MTARPPSIVAREAVVWPVSSSCPVCTLTRTRSPDSPSSSHAICASTGVAPLAHLGPGMEQRDGPVGLRPQDRLTVLRHAVADPGVLRRARDACEPGAAVGVSDGKKRLLQADTGAQLLARAEPVADVDRVAPADFPAVDPHALRQAVEHPLKGEVRLVGPEPAHSTARGVVV